MERKLLQKMFAAMLGILVPSYSCAQFNIVYDGTGKDIVTSLKIRGDDYIDYTFKYDDKNRLESVSTFLLIDKGSTNETHTFVCNYNWSEGLMNIVGNYENMPISSLNGVLNSDHNVTLLFPEWEEREFRFVYDDKGYFTSCNGGWGIFTAEWKDGDLISTQSDENGFYYTYSDIENHANIDFGMMGSILESIIGNYPMPWGQIPKHLPKNITEQIHGQLSYEAEFEYETDSRGRLTKIINHEKEYENGSMSENTSIMEIFYDGSTESGISSVIQSTTRADSLYDLSGRRVTMPQHGLYIKNGRKVIR